MASVLTDEDDCSKQIPVNDSFNQLDNEENICNKEVNCNVSLTGGAPMMPSTSLQMKPVCENNNTGCWSSSPQNKELEDDYLYNNDSLENFDEKIAKDDSVESQKNELHSLTLHKHFQNDSSSYLHCGNASLITNDNTTHGNNLISPSSSIQHSPCASPVYFPCFPESTSIDQSVEAERSPVYIPPSPSFNYNNFSTKPMCSLKSPSTQDLGLSPENNIVPLVSPGHQKQSCLTSSACGTSPGYTAFSSRLYSSLNSMPQHDDASSMFTPMLPSELAQSWSSNIDIQEKISANDYIPSSVRESFIPLSNSQPICKITSTCYALGSSPVEECRNVHDPPSAECSSTNLSSERFSIGSSFEYLNQKRYSFDQSDRMYQLQEKCSTAGNADADSSDDSLDIIELERDVKVPEVITLADDSGNEADGDVAGLLRDLSKQEKSAYQRLSNERNVLLEQQAQHPSTVSSHRKHKRSEHQSKKRHSATISRQTVKERASSGTRSTRRRKFSSRHSRGKESNLILESLDAKPPPGSIGELLLKNHTKRFVEKVIVSTRPTTSSHHTNSAPTLEKPSGDSTGANTEEEEELLLLRKEALQSVVQVLDQRNSQQATVSPVDSSLVLGSSESSPSLCNKIADTECSDLSTSPNKSLIQECQDPIDMEISVSDIDDSTKGIESSELREVGDNINIPIEWAYMIPPPSADQKNDIHNFEHFSLGQNLCKQAMESTSLKSSSDSAVLSEYPVNVANSSVDNNYLMQSSDGASFQSMNSVNFLAEASYLHPHNAPSFDSIPFTGSNNLPPTECNNFLPTVMENRPQIGCDDFPPSACSNLPPTGSENLPPTGRNDSSLPNFSYDYSHSLVPRALALSQCEVTHTLSEKNAFNQEAFMDAVTNKKSNEGNLIHIKINKTSQKMSMLNQGKTRKGRKHRKKALKKLFNSGETLPVVRDNSCSVGNTLLQFPPSSAGGRRESEMNNMADASGQDDDETLLRNQLLQSLQLKTLDPRAGLTYRKKSHQSVGVQKPLISNWRSSTNSTTISPNMPLYRVGYVFADGSIKDGNTYNKAAADTSVGKLPVVTFRYPKSIAINLNNDSDSDSTQESGPGAISSNENSSALLNNIDSFLKGIREGANCRSGNEVSTDKAAAGGISGTLKSPEFTATPKVMQHLSRPAQMEYWRMKLRMQEIHQAKKLRLSQIQSRLETLTEQSTASDCSTDCSHADLMTERTDYYAQSFSPSGDISSELTDEHDKEPPGVGDNSPLGRENDAGDLRQLLLKNRSNWNKEVAHTHQNLDNDSSQNSGEDLRNFLQRNADLNERKIRESSDPDCNSSAEPSDVPSNFSEKVQCYIREARKKSESCVNDSTGHPLKKPDFDSSSSDSDTDSDSSLSSTSSSNDRSQNNKQSPYKDPTINNPFPLMKLVESPPHTSECGSRLDNQLSPAPTDGSSSEVSSSTDSDCDSTHSSDKITQKSVPHDSLVAETFTEPCPTHLTGDVANRSSNEAILEDVQSKETVLGKISTSIVSESQLGNRSHEIVVSAEESTSNGTPLDNLLNTLKSLIHSGENATNATTCSAEGVKMLARITGDVCNDASSLHTCPNQKAHEVHTSDETSIICNTELSNSNGETPLAMFKKNEPSLENTLFLDESNSLSTPIKLGGINDEVDEEKDENLQDECSHVQKSALDTSINVDSTRNDSSSRSSCDQGVVSDSSNNIPAGKTAEDHSTISSAEMTVEEHSTITPTKMTVEDHSTITTAEKIEDHSTITQMIETDEKRSAITPDKYSDEDHSTITPAEKTVKDHSAITPVEKTVGEHFGNTSAASKKSSDVSVPAVELSINTRADAERKGFLAMLSKYEQLLQGRRFNLGSLEQQVRRQSSVAAKAELECQKSLTAVERARKQLAALEAHHRVKAAHQTQSREMLVRMKTQQVADTATLAKLQHKTEHLGRQVKGMEYRIPGSSVNAPGRGVSNLSLQTGIASRASKRPSDSPATTLWAKRSNTWVNASYSVNNSVSWQQNRAASALNRDSSGLAHQDLAKFNKYSRNNNAVSVPKRITTPSKSKSATVFNSSSKVSHSLPATSANVTSAHVETNDLSPRNQLKSPAVPNVSPISKISKLHPLSESELRDRLLKKHKYAQLPKSDSNVTGVRLVSFATPKQSTLCPYDLLGTCHDENCSLEHISCSTPSSISSDSTQSSKPAQGVPTNTCHPQTVPAASPSDDTCKKGSKRSLTERSESTNKKQRVSEEDVTGEGKVYVSSSVESVDACGESGDGDSVRLVSVDESDVTDATVTDTSIVQPGLTPEAKQANNDSDDSSSDSEDSDSSSSDSDDSESELTSSDTDSPPRSPIKSSPESPVSKTNALEIHISEKDTRSSVIVSDSSSRQTRKADHTSTSVSRDGTRSCPPFDITMIKVNPRRRVSSISDLTEDHNVTSFNLVKESLRACSIKPNKASEKHVFPIGCGDFRNCNTHTERDTGLCTNRNVCNRGPEHTDVAPIVTESSEKEIVGNDQNRPSNERVNREQLENCTSDNISEQSDHSDKLGNSTCEFEHREIPCENEFPAPPISIENHESCTTENVSEQSALACPNDAEDITGQSDCVATKENCAAGNLNDGKVGIEEMENCTLDYPNDRIVCAEHPKVRDVEKPDDQSTCIERSDEQAAENQSEQSICEKQLEKCKEKNSDFRSVLAGQSEKYEADNPDDESVCVDQPGVTSSGSFDEASIGCNNEENCAENDTMPSLK